MVNRYPEAAKYLWLTKRKPVDVWFYNKPYLPKYINDVRYFGIRVSNKISRMLNLGKLMVYSDDMNPIDAWVTNDAKVRKYLDTYFEKWIHRIYDEKLRFKASKMYKEGGAWDKVMVVYLISVWKLYFSDKEKMI